MTSKPLMNQEKASKELESPPIMSQTVSHIPIESEIPIDSQKVGASSKSMKCPPTGAARTCEDGYNWRKYGQKNVKTSPYPRSYYKCTHPNCKVKRKLQCSPDGQIIKIIYDGVHCHPRRDQLNRQEFLRSLFLHNQMSESSNGSGAEDSEAMLTCAIFELDGTPELSLGDNDDDESQSKRRKIEISFRRPRVVVLIDSGVDGLDDGYCWRKYGKKFVKGNVNPRSYYKCTSTGCSVRKQVERASHDWKSFSITYDGKHNHEVPAAENLNTNGAKAEAQSQDHSPFLQRINHDVDNETILSTLLGDSKSGEKIESPPSGYQLKLKNSLLSGSSLTNFSMPSSPLCSNVGNHGRENGFAQYCFGWDEQLWENDTRSIEPYKQEQRDDNLCSFPPLPMMNYTNASQTWSSSSSSSSSWSVW